MTEKSSRVTGQSTQGKAVVVKKVVKNTLIFITHGWLTLKSFQQKVWQQKRIYSSLSTEGIPLNDLESNELKNKSERTLVTFSGNI